VHRVMQSEMSGASVGPRNSGSIHCAAGSIIRDPEPKSY